MAGLERKGCGFAISFTLAMVTACGGSQPPIGAPNGMSQNATRQEPGSRALCKGGPRFKRLCLLSRDHHPGIDAVFCVKRSLR
jgi:hypothetical protein